MTGAKKGKGSKTKPQGLLTELALSRLKKGGSRSELAPRGSGVLQAKKLASGSIAFYFRYTKPDGSRDRLRLTVGISLVEARSQARTLSAQYQAGSGDVRDDQARDANVRALEQQAAQQRSEEALAKKNATLGALLDAYSRELEANGKSSARSVASTLYRHVRNPWPTLWASYLSSIFTGSPSRTRLRRSTAFCEYLFVLLLAFVPVRMEM